jgi:hypothetical protein
MPPVSTSISVRCMSCHHRRTIDAATLKRFGLKSDARSRASSSDFAAPNAAAAASWWKECLRRQIAARPRLAQRAMG